MFRFRAEGDIKKLVLGTPDRRSSARRQKNVRDHNRIIGDVRHQVADTKIQEMRSVSPVPLGGGSRWSAGSRPLEAAFFIDQVTRLAARCIRFHTAVECESHSNLWHLKEPLGLHCIAPRRSICWRGIVPR